MRAILRGVGLVIVIAVTWGMLLFVVTGDYGAEGVAGELRIVVALLAFAALGVGLLGGGRRGRPAEGDQPVLGLSRFMLARLAVLILAAWSLFLLGQTRYLEPLPLEAGTIAGGVLVIVALGAGLISGWQWWTVLALPAAAVGLLWVSEGLFDSGASGDSGGPFHPALEYGLLLVPVAVGVGALTARLAARGWLVGAALLALPLVVVAWAGFRHAWPIDRQPTDPLLISYPRYREASLGEDIASVVSRLGRPDERIREFPSSDLTAGYSDLRFGLDTLFFVDSARTEEKKYELESIEIEDPAAQTTEGVGMGDNLSLARSRLDARCSYTDFQPYCYRDFDAAGDKTIWFFGDPITRIELN